VGRQALGTAVFSGMIGVTFFGMFLTPVFFSVIMKLFSRRMPATSVPEAAAASEVVSRHT
jgi:hydrophobic/amphiphilic exporter-1 (mainly G- bacteria), HAE1 family